MTLNPASYTPTYFEAAGFDTAQAAALSEVVTAIIDDINAYRNEIFVSGTGQYLKWSGIAEDYPNVTP